MCGIVGYVGPQRPDLAPFLLTALATLEYRGYDSAGIAVLDSRGLSVAKSIGGLANLSAKTCAFPAGSAGFAHTRWATHGAATEANAHPHVTPDGRLALVLNGIVENDAALRKVLAARGVVLTTGNDTETLLRWIEAHLENAIPTPEDLEVAVKKAFVAVTGNIAFAVLHVARPETMIVAKRGSPLAVALAKNGRGLFVASDAAAVRDVADHVHYLEDGDILRLTAGVEPTRQFAEMDAAIIAPTKEGFESYTLKEIHEQPRVLVDVVQAALAKTLLERGLTLETVSALDRVVLVACGSAYFAASAAKALIERHARLPAEAAIASELRLGDPVLTPRTLVVAVSQSGETADTLACLKMAKAAGAPTLAVCNVAASSIAREASAFWPLACGPEVGVASTKAYAAMLVQLAFLSFELGLLRGTVPPVVAAELASAARELPSLVARALQLAPRIEERARQWRDKRGILFLGRHLFHQAACEGALKLRELAYLHAEGYAAGELKHGSIALVEPGMPVIAIAPRGATAAKMASSIHEVKARGAHVLGIVTEGDGDVAGLCDEVWAVPATMEALLPVVVAVPLHLFAYGFARELGRPIDRPRNLAKSVTVE